MCDLHPGSTKAPVQDSEDALDKIEQLVKALDLDKFNTAPPSLRDVINLPIEPYLNHKATKMYDVKRPSGSREAFASKICQFPVKGWYTKVIANTLNELASLDMITGINSVVSMRLSNGHEDSSFRDMGPDDYSCVSIIVYSEYSNVELNEFLNNEFFLQGGELGSKDWASLSERVVRDPSKFKTANQVRAEIERQYIDTVLEFGTPKKLYLGLNEDKLLNLKATIYNSQVVLEDLEVHYVNTPNLINVVGGK